MGKSTISNAVSWRTLGAICFVVLVDAIVFRNSFFGDLLFLGDSDRLNTFLSLRLASFREILEAGSAATWNENMFMGFSTAGLHWIYPPADPVSYILTWLRPDDILHLLPVISALQLVLTGLFAFLFIYDVVPSRIPSVIGAILYSLSVFSVQHVSQADSSHLVIALLPLAMYFVNKTTQSDPRNAFVGLTLTIAAMLWFSFLQDVAYALFLVGLYAVFRTIENRNGRYFYLTLVAGLVASLAALPRIVTVYQELALLVRTGAFATTNSIEILRLFDDGAFGRYFAEAHAYGNGLNIHEGLQLLHSSAAVIVILAGLFFASSRTSRVLLKIILIFVFAFVFQEEIVQLRPDGQLFERYRISDELFSGTVVTLVALFGAIATRFFRARRKPSSGHQENYNIFGALVLIFVLGIVLVPEVRYLIYRLFMRFDFSHSRISMIAILPLCVMVANYLLMLTSRDQTDESRVRSVVVISAILLMGAIAVLIQSEFVGELLPDGSSLSRRWYQIIGVEALRTALFMLISFILFILAIKASHGDTRLWSRSALIVLILAETLTNASFRVNGAHTETYPVPFDDNNFFNVPKAAIKTPTRDEVSVARSALETEAYRSAAVINPFEFPAYGGVVPHLSQFWRLRFAEGYSTGVPQRLAALPWPDKTTALRAIAFQNDKELPAALLAVLNVKYLLPVDPGLFYNAFDGGIGASGFSAAKNPYPVLPRAFFVNKVEALPSDVQGFPQFAIHLRALKRAGKWVSKIAPDPKRTMLDLISVPVPGSDNNRPIAVATKAGAHLTWPLRNQAANIRIERRIDGPSDNEDFFYLLNQRPWSSEISIPVNREGRFVRIQASNLRHILLAEIEVIGCRVGAECGSDMSNLARGKRVRQSTTLGAGQIENAVDGSINTYSATGPDDPLSTPPNEQPWLEIDLSDEYTINEIIMRRHKINAEKPIYRYFNIYVSSALLPIKRPPGIEGKNLPGTEFVRVKEVPEADGHFLDTALPTGMQGTYRITRCLAENCDQPEILIVRDDLGQVFGEAAKIFVPNIAETLRETKNGAFIRERIDPQKLMRVSYVDDPGVIEKSLNGRTEFPADGRIDGRFDGDRIVLDVEPSPNDRVMVLNELYHPRWRAYADGSQTALFPINIVMRGVLVPAGAKTITLKFVPHTVSSYGLATLAFSGVLFVACWFFLGWRQRQRAVA